MSSVDDGAAYAGGNQHLSGSGLRWRIRVTFLSGARWEEPSASQNASDNSAPARMPSLLTDSLPRLEMDRCARQTAHTLSQNHSTIALDDAPAAESRADPRQKGQGTMAKYLVLKPHPLENIHTTSRQHRSEARRGEKEL